MRWKTTLCTLAAAGCASATGLAAILTTVPMQGTMVMPVISYHAADGTLTVQLDSTVPQLTPLLVSHPGSCFDPADPWHECLDPGRQGLAFSRRYGFTMDAATDPIPAGTAIWIRKLGSTPGLGLYRYRSTAPKAWEPIFGTGTSSNALAWDGSMFHPAIAARAEISTHQATFEAFLLDTATGKPVAGANTGVFVFNWTVIPDGRPALCLGRDGTITWPNTATNYVLECAATLNPATCNWVPVTNAPVAGNGTFAVRVDPARGAGLYRLRLAPAP